VLFPQEDHPSIVITIFFIAECKNANFIAFSKTEFVLIVIHYLSLAFFMSCIASFGSAHPFGSNFFPVSSL